MKKALILFVVILASCYVNAQTTCSTLPCPQIRKQTIIENTNPCSGNQSLHPFELMSGTDNLCEGESFTYVLRNSAGTIIHQITGISSSNFYLNLNGLCTGTYSVCVILNSDLRDCEESCMSFYFVNNGEGCCSSS